MEPLQHIEALLDETRGACWFTKFDLAQGYHQVRRREADLRKTSFRCHLGQFEWKLIPFGLQGSSSILIRVMNAAMTRRPPRPPLAPEYREPTVLSTGPSCFIWITLYATILHWSISATSERSSRPCARRSSTSRLAWAL